MKDFITATGQCSVNKIVPFLPVIGFMTGIVKFNDVFRNQVWSTQNKINVLGLHFIKVGFISILPFSRFNQIQKPDFCQKNQIIVICKLL